MVLGVLSNLGGLIKFIILYTLGGVSLIDTTYGFILFHNIKQTEVAAEVAPPLRSYLVNNAAVCTTLDYSYSLRHPELRFGATSAATSVCFIL